jgi:lysophospholipase L1-like esterase
MQEARAMAGGQGQNRLEVVLGDSFGLWIPPEMLPRDRLWLNQSISGDTTAGIGQRVTAFAGTRPTTIHLMAGANDLKNGVPETQIVRNVQQTVRLLRQQHPQAKIVIYSVLPTRRAEIGNERVRSLNARLALLSQQSQVEYRDINQWFQDEWGHLRQDLTTDGLHLNPQGYALWQQALLARAQ